MNCSFNKEQLSQTFRYKNVQQVFQFTSQTGKALKLDNY